MENHQKITAIGLALTYAGSFFGAGFVSGQELWQFFGSFGKNGYFGIPLAILLFFMFGVLIVRLVQISGKTSFDEIIVIGNYHKLRNFFSTLIVFMMFGIFVIMCAGTGALINQTFNLPTYFGCGLFCIIIAIAAMNGIFGTVKIFSFLVPVMVIATIIICFTTVQKYGITFTEPFPSKNPLLGSWWFSALTYVSYNIITLIGTLVPVGALIKKRSSVYIGIALGCLMALLLSISILFALSTMFEALNKELPMLEIAFRIHNTIGMVYSVLLVFGMFGTSLASIVSIIAYAENKFNFVKYHKNVTVIAIELIGFLCSLAGFGNLVGTIYPIFGYIGFIILITLIGNYIYLKSKNKHTNSFRQ